MRNELAAREKHGVKRVFFFRMIPEHIYMMMRGIQWGGKRDDAHE
jgi:hypothetical protein